MDAERLVDWLRDNHRDIKDALKESRDEMRELRALIQKKADTEELEKFVNRMERRFQDLMDVESETSLIGLDRKITRAQWRIGIIITVLLGTAAGVWFVIKEVISNVLSST